MTLPNGKHPTPIVTFRMERKLLQEVTREAKTQRRTRSNMLVQLIRAGLSLLRVGGR